MAYSLTGNGKGIDRVVACPRRELSFSGDTIAAGQEVTVAGQREIGMLGGQPQAADYYFLAFYAGADTAPHSILYSDGDAWDSIDTLEEARARVQGGGGSDGETAVAGLDDLVAAIDQLGDADFTTSGTPKTTALASAAGVAQVSGADRDAAWAAYQAKQGA